MIPLIPTLALVLVSLPCSAFVIFRTILSVLSPRTLSRRLYPLHYRPPSSRELPPADKSYIWLALCDLSALGVFVWEVFAQWSSSSSSAHGSTPGISATSRLWLALTLRQTCFLIVSALILTHVRLRKSVSFGTAHCLLWVPLVFLATVSTIVAGAFAATTTYPGRIFRVGFITYSSAIALLNTIMFGCLVGTLIIIRRSLENFQKAQGFQPSNESADRSQDADIDVIREGSSWITSTTSSRQRQDAANLSPFSTRTRHTSQSAAASPEWGAMPLRFPFWPPPGPHPYSSLPQTSPRRDDAHYKDFEPFRRRAQSLRAAALTLSSGNSWITSSLGTHPTLSAWSYPTVPTLSSHQVTGSAIASPPTRNRSTASVRFPTVAAPIQAEKGQASPLSDSPASPVLEISVVRIIAWLAGVWVPLLFALPYVIHLGGSNLQSNESASILLAISVTVSSPILALNLLLRHPISRPSGVFNAPREPHPVARPYASPSLSDRSGGMKQVTGPHGANNFKRLLGVLGPAPKLSLLPSNDMKTPQSSARNEHAEDNGTAGAGDDVPPPRKAQTPPQHRHSFHHHPHYAQSYRHAYDRARDRGTHHTRSFSLPFPTRDTPHDLF